MSRFAALIGHQTICTVCHRANPQQWSYIGNIVEGSKQCFINGRPVARIGDMGICISPTYMVEGSKTCFVDGRPVHRIGDLNSCQGPTIGPPENSVMIGD